MSEVAAPAPVVATESPLGNGSATGNVSPLGEGQTGVSPLEVDPAKLAPKPAGKKGNRAAAEKKAAAAMAKKMLDRFGGDAPAAETPAPEAPAKTSEPGKVAAALADEKKPEAAAPPKPETEAKAKALEEAKAARAKEEAEEKQWREIRRQKKAAREWRAEQERTKIEQAADAKLKSEDPYAWAERHGLSFAEIAKREVDKASATPEQKRIAELDAKNKEISDKLEKIEKQRAEEAKTAAAREADAARSAAVAEHNRDVATHFEKSKVDYPLLSQFRDPAEIQARALDLQIQFMRATKGKEASMKDLLDHMEEEVSKESARYLRAQSAALGSGEAATPAAEPAKPAAMVRPVTNRTAATDTTPAANLTQAQRRARSEKLAEAHLASRR